MSDSYHPDLIGLGQLEDYFKAIPKQTIFSDFGNPEAIVQGDCWRCCVAAMIGRPASEVPHFVQIAFDGRKNADSLTAEWLWNNHNLRMLETAHEPWLNWFEGRPFTPVIVSGPTIRSKNSSHWHAVVMAAGKLMYDPHPDDAGLLHNGRFAYIFSTPL